eukprot:gene4704-3397_t
MLLERDAWIIAPQSKEHKNRETPLRPTSSDCAASRLKKGTQTKSKRQKGDSSRPFDYNLGKCLWIASHNGRRAQMKLKLNEQKNYENKKWICSFNLAKMTILSSIFSPQKTCVHPKGSPLMDYYECYISRIDLCHFHFFFLSLFMDLSPEFLFLFFFRMNHNLSFFRHSVSHTKRRLAYLPVLWIITGSVEGCVWKGGKGRGNRLAMKPLFLAFLEIYISFVEACLLKPHVREYFNSDVF